MRTAKTEDRVEYRVRIQNFPTQRDAAAAVEKLKALGLAEAAITK
jgi:cell division protein FtsN